MKKGLWVLGVIVLLAGVSAQPVMAGPILGGGSNGTGTVGDGSTGDGGGAGGNGDSKNSVEETVSVVPDEHKDATEGMGGSESNTTVQAGALQSANLQPISFEDSEGAMMPEELTNGKGNIAAEDALANKLDGSTRIAVEHGEVDVKSLEPGETKQS
jgi:hypothetical protein